MKLGHFAWLLAKILVKFRERLLTALVHITNILKRGDDTDTFVPI